MVDPPPPYGYFPEFRIQFGFHGCLVYRLTSGIWPRRVLKDFERFGYIAAAIFRVNMK